MNAQLSPAKTFAKPFDIVVFFAAAMVDSASLEDAAGTATLVDSSRHTPSRFRG